MIFVQNKSVLYQNVNQIIKQKTNIFLIFFIQQKSKYQVLYMKIIIRDVFKRYFPKYNPIYTQLAQSNKKSISYQLFSQNLQQQNEKVSQQIIPQQLLNRKSSNKKQKKLQLNLNKSKSTEDNAKIKNSLTNKKDKTNQQENQLLFTGAQKQKLNQIVGEKLQFQLISFIQNHKFYHLQNDSFTPQICIKQIKQILLQCIKKLQIFNSHPSAKSHSRNHTKQTKPLLAGLQSATSNKNQQNIYKLSLYLNRQTNKQIFTVYEHILASTVKNGISYETLAKKMKTDIINISHYCCKLKKMRFVDWEHRKQGIMVFPKKTQTQQEEAIIKRDTDLVKVNLQKQQKSFNYEKSFLFHQLTLNQNILVNVASATSLTQGGLTNEEIKFKIMKHAQNKMVRRTVEGMKNIQKNAQRQGKVFQFKYKKQTQLLNKQLDKKRIQNSGIIQLTQTCRNYLNKNHGKQQICEKNKNSIIADEQASKIQGTIQLLDSFKNQQLLLNIINTKLTDYISSIGVKQSKRQCTPLKLNRYIYILNYLQQKGPDTQYQLRRHIIQMQKQMQQANGIIHKRSMIGILEGLKKIQLIQEIDEYYYPKWIQGLKRRENVEIDGKKNKQMMDDDQLDLDAMQRKYNQNVRKKKIKNDNNLSSDKLNNSKNSLRISLPNTMIRKISKKQHRIELFAELFNIIFQKTLKRIFRRGFDRIIYVQRKKQSVQTFCPQNNLLHLLDQDYKAQNIKQLKQHSTILESFISQIDNFVQLNGRKLQNFGSPEYEVVKYVRTNPNKKPDILRSKYGKNWADKFSPLQNQKVIKVSEEGYQTLQSFQGYLV